MFDISLEMSKDFQALKLKSKKKGLKNLPIENGKKLNRFEELNQPIYSDQVVVDTKNESFIPICLIK